MIPRRVLSRLCLVLVFLGPIAASAGPLQTAQNQLERGEYGVAVKALMGLKTPAAEALLARAYLETGRYEDAITLAAKLRTRKKVAAAVAVIAARAEVALGQYEAAIKRLRAEIGKRPDNYEARVVMAEARWTTGTARSNLSEADAIADDWNEGKVKSAVDLAWLGRGLHLTEYFKDANEILFEARDKDPKLVVAHLLHARLFLEKADEAQAGEAVEAALKVNPNHAEALVRASAMDLSSDADTVKAGKNIRKALETNPRYVPGLRAKARLFIEQEQYDDAIGALNEALKVNSRDPETLALMGAAHLVKEDDKAFSSWMKRALRVNKRFALGYHIAAEVAVRQHRYVDGIALERKAIKLDPDFAPAYVGLGIGLSRVGKDEEANEALQRAHALDTYNVQAFNMTEGFYDGPINDMVWKEFGPFKLRLHKTEAEAMSAFLPDFLKRAYATHKKKYKFTPKSPISVEIFPSEEVFAIRTSGYPQLSVHAVCFGQVITSRSPSLGNFNWGMVMWHELAHVWHIQMSNSRVPRWFTEGLAEHETTLERPEWKREMDSELQAALVAGELKGVAEFNTMFVHAKSLNDILVAYYYASKVIKFIDQKWGFAVFPKMLKAWGRRQPTDRVFEAVLGLSLDDFDKQMTEYLKTDLLKHLADDFMPDETSTDAAADAFHRGQKALREKRPAEAAAAFDEVIAAGKDGVVVRLLRGAAAMDMTKGADPADLSGWKDAKIHLQAGLAIDPERMELWSVLATVAGKLSDTDTEAIALYNVARLDENSDKAAAAAFEMALATGDAKRALHFAEQLLHIRPVVAATHLSLAHGYILNGRTKQARQALTVMDTLGGEPLRPRMATLVRARVLIKEGKKSKARALLKGLEPGPDLKDVQERL
ncbi:MAG: tetratricopeptide (TPR) repeat protein [Myxococcota bacterium]|jgi:tetratricopeptide (TPR) repeat protein